MLEWISWFVIGYLFVLLYNYLYCKINNIKIDLLRVRTILICVVVTITGNIMNVYMNDMFIVIFKYILMVFMFKSIYNEKTSKTIITTLFIYIIFILCELIFGVIFIFLLSLDQDYIKDTILGYFFSNVTILVIAFLTIKIPLLIESIRNAINWYSEKEIVNSIVLSLIAIITVCYLLYQNYLEVTSKRSFMITNMFLLGIVVFIIGFFKEKTDNNKLTSEYDQLLQYVKTYEEVIEEKSKNQHEYQNQLILIKEMLGTRNKKVRDHISELLELEDQTEKYNWLNKLKNIPNGGLKGLIHYKITEMMKKDIKLYVDINDNVNNKRINKYLNDNLHDISKIIGVYIDNAIEAAVESKQRYIIIEAMIENNKLDFSISNTYSGTIDFNSIDKKGYSKKGKGRGYGLSLVQDIINRRKDIDQYREFNGIFFVQKTRFQYKK